MTSVRDFEDLAERTRAALEPDDASINRIELRYRRLSETSAMASSPRPARRWRLLAATAALTAAIAIGVPFAINAVDGAGPSSVRVPLTASEAFAHAASAAATEDWHPLAAGEYHHLLTLGLAVPQNPWQGADKPYISKDLSAGAIESWVARDGSGRVVTIQGLRGNDPDSYARLTYDKRGHVSMSSWKNHASGTPLPIREQLRYADTVDVLSWDGPPDEPAHVTWYRQPEGYVPSRMPGRQGYIPTAAQGTTAEKFQTMAWGNTMAHFDRLNDLEGAKLRTELLQLIAEGPVPGQTEYELGGDTYGATPEVIATEARIERAVRLLGAAPLAPHVRSAIFTWLSTQDPEAIETNARDVLGRRGTRVTFKAEHERAVPGRTWSIDEIVAAAKGKGQPVIGTLDAKPSYDVDAYTEYRQWYVDVIFDERTGRLLQEASHLKWGSDGAEPSLTWEHTRTRTPTTAVELRPEAGVVGTGTAYLAVDRTTDFSATSAVCREHPETCR